MADVAIVLLDGNGQIFAGVELRLRDETVVALPIVGDEGLAFETDFVEEFFASRVITAAKNPGDGFPSNWVISSPNPELTSFF